MIMKTILLLTDFSIRAEQAAGYALQLAQKTEANLLLCNMFLVPYVEPMTTQLAWPAEDYKTVEQESKDELYELVERLNNKLSSENAKNSYRPSIEICSKSGSISEILKEISDSHNIMMAVIGDHDKNGALFFENHAKKIIEKANFPVLVLPENEKFEDFDKIAFASDLSISDIDVLHDVVAFAKLFDAEVLLTHVNDENGIDDEQDRDVKNFFKMVSAEVKYPKLNYKEVKSKSVTNGLDWLTDSDHIDLLVLVHRKRNFWYRLLEGSVTQRMANHLRKPLLVLPGVKVVALLPVY